MKPNKKRAERGCVAVPNEGGAPLGTAIANAIETAFSLYGRPRGLAFGS
jgi:hypothetical protein